MMLLKALNAPSSEDEDEDLKKALELSLVDGSSEESYPSKIVRVLFIYFIFMILKIFLISHAFIIKDCFLDLPIV